MVKSFSAKSENPSNRGLINANADVATRNHLSLTNSDVVREVIAKNIVPSNPAWYVGRPVQAKNEAKRYVQNNLPFIRAQNSLLLGVTPTGGASPFKTPILAENM